MDKRKLNEDGDPDWFWILAIWVPIIIGFLLISLLG
jgi:hypothetical protein